MLETCHNIFENKFFFFLTNLQRSLPLLQYFQDLDILSKFFCQFFFWRFWKFSEGDENLLQPTTRGAEFWRNNVAFVSCFVLWNIRPLWWWIWKILATISFCMRFFGDCKATPIAFRQIFLLINSSLIYRNKIVRKRERM